jgi:hypothetical protein
MGPDELYTYRTSFRLPNWLLAQFDRRKGFIMGF